MPPPPVPSCRGTRSSQVANSRPGLKADVKKPGIQCLGPQTRHNPVVGMSTGVGRGSHPQGKRAFPRRTWESRLCDLLLCTTCHDSLAASSWTHDDSACGTWFDCNLPERTSPIVANCSTALNRNVRRGVQTAGRFHHECPSPAGCSLHWTSLMRCLTLSSRWVYTPKQQRI